MFSLYRLLLMAYPAKFRYEFADEMLAVHREAWIDLRARPFGERMRFLLREMIGLLSGAARARSRRAQSLHRESRRPPGARRFSPLTLPAMASALAAVAALIAKAQGLSYALGYSHYQVNWTAWPRALAEPVWPSRYGLLSGIFMWLLLSWGAGAVVWVGLYALRQSQGRAAAPRQRGTAGWER